MNILQVTHSYLPPSGMEYVVHNLSNALTKKGNRVTVFCFYPRRRSETSILDDEKYTYSVYRYHLPRTYGLFHKTIFKYHLNKVLRNGHYDIMHVHMAYPTYYLSAKTNRYDIPHILTPHGADIQIDKDSNYGVRLNNKNDLKVREVLNKAKTITAISNSMRNEMINLGADPRKIKIIPNGIVFEKYKNYRYKTDSTSPFIFSMGRFVKKKGFDLLVKIYENYIKLGGKLNLIIAGDGSEKNNIKNIIMSTNLGDKIKLVGYLREKEKIFMLSKCCYFVCPSVREPFGIVNIEAFSFGKPVIAFNVDGLTDIIEDEIDGFLIEPFNLSSFAAKMILLEKNELRMTNMSKNAIVKASKYDWCHISELYLETYKKAIRSTL